MLLAIKNNTYHLNIIIRCMHKINKMFDCRIGEYYFHVTVLLESIDLFIVLLKGGAVCT